MNANGIGASRNASATGMGTASGAAAAPGGPAATEFAQILEDFKKVASQTPVERAIAAVLKKHGLTKESYDRLPAAQKAVIAREIKAAVKHVVGTDNLRDEDMAFLK